MTQYEVARVGQSRGWRCLDCGANGDGLESEQAASAVAENHVAMIHGGPAERVSRSSPLEALSAAIEHLDAAISALAEPANEWPVIALCPAALLDVGLRLRGFRDLVRERTTDIQADLEQGE